MTRSLEQAIVRFPVHGERRWLHFRHPRRTIVAGCLDEVVCALADAQAAARGGQWVAGFVAYDAAPAFDPALVALRHPGVPLLCLGVFDAPQAGGAPPAAPWALSRWCWSRDRAAHEAAMRRIRDHLAAGEIYQVNWTLRLRSRFDGDPLGLFAALERAQPCAHAAFLRLDGAAVCSASPELFLRLDRGRVESRPMKGTRPRGVDARADRELRDELTRSGKERAENTMIVDMVRSDLGRIARTGTLRVPRMLEVESYPTVHQMTSTVTAQTAASLPELFRAAFPAASITGAPKVRCSALIAALEAEPRGLYTGAIGVISPDGAAEFSVAIRTVWLDLAAGTAEYGVGGGVVWDSTAAGEWAELRAKTRIVERARAPFRLLETMAWVPGEGIARLARHVDRLTASAAHFGFALDVAALHSRLCGLAFAGPVRLRLLVDEAGNLELEALPMPAAAAGPWQVPVDREPVDAADEFLQHKTTRRERYDAARARFPDAPDVILWNEAGELTETTIGNLVLELDGSLLTPARRCGLLAGTLRAELLAAGTLREATLRLPDLGRASRVWMINAVRGWTPIVACHVPTQP
jgi:para-aminobenzoate synthetase/4-amino-4-deoxychorismate lyase